MSKMKKMSVILICLFTVLGIGKGISMVQSQRISACPDAINSFRFNTTEYLSVVANQNDIKDKHDLAKQIIKMCQENSFQSIKFSYDMVCPAELQINVYSTEKDFYNNKKFCEITFLPEERNEKYDIIHNSDKFILYVDGEKVD